MGDYRGTGVYEKLIEINEAFALESLERQSKDEGSRFFGGVVEPGLGIATPSHWGTAMYISHWIAALCNPDSPSYRNTELLRGLELGLHFMLRSQHPDGTISPHWTNMHSPPDTAFVVGGLAQAYEVLEGAAQEWEPFREALGLLRQFLEQAVPAMLSGGCHTPNHRWILTSAIGFLYKLTGKPELKERAMAWLAEGIDCTPDGEWTERSNGIYNSVSDIALIYAAEQLKLPELLEPVRRNLRMMAYLVHPGGDVVTDYSGRQDFGDRHNLGSYFVALRWMAHHDKDPLLAALSELAGSQLQQPGGLPTHVPIALLRYPELRELSVEPEPLPEHYRVMLNANFDRSAYVSRMADAGHHGVIYHSKLHPDFGAPVARIRSGAVSATVMTENTSFFAVRNGAASLLAVQVASFFGPGYVRMQQLEEQGDGSYRLNAVEKKGYYGPVSREQLPETAGGPVSPWYLLPHQHREVTHEQSHHVEVQLKETDRGWRITVACQYEAPILTTVSFVFGSEGTLSYEGLQQEAGHLGAGVSPAQRGASQAQNGASQAQNGASQAQNGASPTRKGASPAGMEFSPVQLWSEGSVRYTAGEDWIEVTGGAQQHNVKGISNAPHPAGCQTLLINLVTPYRHTFDIILSGKG